MNEIQKNVSGLIVVLGVFLICIVAQLLRNKASDRQNTAGATEPALVLPSGRDANPVEGAEVIVENAREGKKKQSLSQSFEDVLSHNKTFERIMRLSEKALPTREEKAEVAKIVSEAGEIRVWIGNLSEIKEKDVDLIRQIERMHSLTSLSIAAQWKENPQRDLIEELLLEAFAKKLNRSDMSDALKSSLVADKIEIWGILEKHFPESARVFEEALQDESIRVLIREAKKHVHIL